MSESTAALIEEARAYRGSDDYAAAVLLPRVVSALEASEAARANLETGAENDKTLLQIVDRAFKEQYARVINLEATIAAALAAERDPGGEYPLTILERAGDPVVLREHDAKVWDEGYDAGEGDVLFASRGLSSDPDAAEHPHKNPYRGDE